MDVPDGNTLSLIDLALADLAEQNGERREGEFTTSEIAKATGKPMSHVRHDAERMIASGKWIRRKAGSKIFYSRVQA